MLREAHIRFELVDVDRFGQSGSSWSSMILEHLLSCSRQSELPVLFVAGQPLGGAGDIAKLAASGELRGLCADAGAQLLEPPEPATALSWTPRENHRWLPPKDINGRRWYQDLPNSASSPDEHEDEARILYNTFSLSRGAGDPRGFPGIAKELLRQDTNLDEPDEYGNLVPYPPFSVTALSLRPDIGWSYYLRSRDLERAKSIGQADVERLGLSKEQLMWVYSQGKKKLVEELELRQCRHKVLTNLDVQNLREALIEEMRKERVFSPTQRGVVPGVVQSLSGPELEEERFAGTDVPLLVAVVSERSPPCWRFRDELQAAAKRMLRAVRVVRLDGQRYPEVVREHGVLRFPTLLWLQARSGTELARAAGVLPASSICERTEALLRGRQLPAAAEEPPRVPRLPSRGIHSEVALAQKWASTRAFRNSAG